MDEPPDPHELDLQHYVLVLRRRKKLVALVTLGMVAAALGVSWLQTPAYQASAEVLLQPRLSDSVFSSNGGSAEPPRTVETEVRVLKSDAVRSAVREKLGTTPRVSASRLGETEVMKVQAEATDPQRAAAIANAYAEGYVNHRRIQAVDATLTAGAAIQMKIDAIQAEIASLDTQISQALPAERASVETRLRPRYASLLSQQSLLQQKLDQVQVDASLKSGGAQVVVVADVPTSPVRPRPLRNALATTIVGFCAGWALALLRERLDDSIKNREDVARVDSELPILGLIPVTETLKRRSRAKDRLRVSAAATEAYRSLRTSVQLLGVDHPVRTIQITSPMPGDGKTSTVASLGVALAAAGQRVLMVDCDLRRPRLHETFELDNSVGFTSLLLGDVSLREAVQRVPGEPRLALLPSGPIPANPSELLSLGRTGELLSKLRETFDVLVIDSPPLLPVTDASVLVTHVDVTLLVLRAGVTTRRQALDALALIRRNHRPVVGAVLNQVNRSAGYGGAYQYESPRPDLPQGRRAAPVGRRDAPSSRPTKISSGPKVDMVRDDTAVDDKKVELVERMDGPNRAGEVEKPAASLRSDVIAKNPENRSWDAGHQADRQLQVSQGRQGDQEPAVRTEVPQEAEADKEVPLKMVRVGKKVMFYKAERRRIRRRRQSQQAQMRQGGRR